MVKRDPLIIRPFGSIGARYRVTHRGLLLHRMNVGFSVAVMVTMVVLLAVLLLPIHPTLLFLSVGFFAIREVLLARILTEATPLDD